MKRMSCELDIAHELINMTSKTLKAISDHTLSMEIAGEAKSGDTSFLDTEEVVSVRVVSLGHKDKSTYSLSIGMEPRTWRLGPWVRRGRYLGRPCESPDRSAPSRSAHFLYSSPCGR